MAEKQHGGEPNPLPFPPVSRRLWGMFWLVLIVAVLAGCDQADYPYYMGGAGEETDTTSVGKEFYLAFQANGAPPTLTLFITGNKDTTGTVEIAGLGTSETFSVTAGEITSVSIDSNAEITSQDLPENLGIHVTAAEGISVYGLNQVPRTTDAFLGLPVVVLGTDYYVMAHENSEFTAGMGSGSHFAIVATEDGTTATITPTATSGTRLAGTAFSITMDQGQTYQLGNDADGDMTGTRVQADKPIVVFSGNQCAFVPAEVGHCDHLVEQMPPVTAWGETFLTVPLATRLNGDTFRVLASEEGTTVSINGVLAATLNAGEFLNEIVTSRAEITASAPVLLVQFSNGLFFDNITSDPFMMLVPTVEQYLSQYTFSTPASGIPTNFINVIAPASDLADLTLDGAAVDTSLFSMINEEYSGGQIPIELGSHTITGSSPFGVFVYGFAEFDSYGYPAGMNIANINP